MNNSVIVYFYINKNEVIEVAKSKIIKDLANGSVSVMEVMYRFKVICHDLNNIELNNWIDKEINGYDEEDKLPKYREYGGGVLLYSGINGSYQVNEATLPLSAITNEDIRKKIQNKKIVSGIAQLEEFAKDNQGLKFDWTYLAPMVLKNMGIHCIEIYEPIMPTKYKEILSKLKSRLIDVLLELEKNFGNLDKLDIDTSQYDDDKLKQINNQVTNIIYDYSIKIGDRNSIEKSNITNK